MSVLRSTQHAAYALVALAAVTAASGCHSQFKASPDPTTTGTAPRNCASLYNGDPHNPEWRQCMGMPSD